MRPINTLSLCAVAIMLGAASSAFAQQKLYVYTSMKESMVGGLKTAFMKKHPDIKIDFQSAGAGKLMAKIAVSMGGRAAEEVVMNTMTNGASQDIQEATSIARR